MNLPSASAQAEVDADSSHPTGTRLQGYWLVLVRLGWVVLSVLALIIFIASLPVYFTRQQESYTAGYAVFLLVLGIFVALGWFIVALLIFWRKSNDWMALLVSLMLVLQGASTIIYPLDVIPSFWKVPALVMNLIAFDLLFLVFCLFPTGRLVPRWILWLGALLIGLEVLAFLPIVPRSYGLLLNLMAYAFLGGFVAAQLYRYHAISTRTERQQTKWIVFGVTVTYLFEFGYVLGSDLFPSFFSTGSLADLLVSPLIVIGLPILIPLSFGFAILRYRLWEIDAIISRTLVYGTLTVSLAVIYEVSVFTLQSLTSGLTFIRGNQLAIVASTFLIGGLFKPLQDRTRALIDRRFYRSKYDGAKTLAAFSATIRDEVDLNQLCTKLTAVVQETMQPAHVSLWLCSPKRYLQETTRALPFIDTIEKP